MARRARRCSQWLTMTAIWLVIILGALAVGETSSFAQGLGGAGTVQGTVKDPTGGVMVAVVVNLANPVSGFRRTATTDAAGKFAFRNLPPNPYHISVMAQGFQPLERDVDVRSAVPIDLDLPLALAGATASVEVVGQATELTEQDPTAHTDLDQNLMGKLPVESSSGLNQIITLASPGVVADSNGFFHPVGDHAQTQFSIDNQPVTDQQSRVYSNQISPDAVQSMEVITGVAPAEFGDKTSLVVQIITKSGLQAKPFGTVDMSYGSFKSPTADVNVGGGSSKVGDFVSLTGMRTDRFLDPAEFSAIHDAGNSQSFFNRFDARPSDRDTVHLNVQSARSSFDIPNTFDQAAAGQVQHQQITTFNVAPGYSRVIGSKGLFTANGFVRRDKLTYVPSADPFADQPGTVSQNRSLTNFGGKVDLAYTSGAHNWKFGGTIGATRLHEQFTIGFTDPTFNSPCVDADGNPVDDPTLRATSQCRGALSGNDAFDPNLLRFDLTRNGAPFVFSGAATVKTQAAYVQDEIKAGDATFKLGLRVDHYGGLTTETMAQPRLGVAYAVPGGGPVLRASYGRTMESPYNENLLLSSGFGSASLLVGEGQPLRPGRRNEGELGIQQGFGRWVVVDIGYFNKHTVNAYDFSVLFNTPIVFPVGWDHSRINGFTGRINLVDHGGFSAFTVLAHTNAIYSPPGVGGVLLSPPPGDFRIDHDQKFNQTTNLQYHYAGGIAPWIAFTWRYDSGLVAGSVPDYATALALTADQQAAIGLFCGNIVATLDAPITSCSSTNRGATRLVIPADGTQDDVTNPARIAPRHLFDLGFGTDNLFHTDRTKVRLRFSVVNLTNRQALYNFLSTFSGTHFVTPRAYQFQVGVTF